MGAAQPAVIGSDTFLDHPMPLLYYRRRYLRIEGAAMAEVEGKPER